MGAWLLSCVDARRHDSRYGVCVRSSSTGMCVCVCVVGVCRGYMYG